MVDPAFPLKQLIETVQELSLARDLERVMTIVRTAARRLTGADGATFVLRDRDHCFYADEDAIAIESNAPRGSVFAVRLPVAGPHGPPRSPPAR